MDPKLLRLVPLLVMLLLALMLAFGLFNHPTLRQEERMVGLNITPFSLPEVSGSGRFSPDLWRGKVAVLNVFASWCAPCAAEAPALMHLAQSGKVPVFGIAWKDKPEDAARYLQTKGNPYQAVGLDVHGETTLPLALTGVPETFIIDKTGHVYFQFNAPISDDTVDKVILPLVAKLDSGNVR